MALVKTETRGATAERPSRIPTFQSEDEAAEWFDTHDTSEFEDEFEDVNDVVFIGLAPNGRLFLWLEPEAVAALEKQAEEQGSRPARLARRWILERLGVPADEPHRFEDD